MAPATGYLALPAIFLSGAAIAEVAVALAFPSTLFGHWKDDRYREKLEWDAFAHFLSDLAQIRKYAPADISMWGEWLVYGTAPGVGDRVEAAMKDLNISIREAGIHPLFHDAPGFLPLPAFAPRGDFRKA